MNFSNGIFYPDRFNAQSLNSFQIFSLKPNTFIAPFLISFQIFSLKFSDSLAWLWLSNEIEKTLITIKAFEYRLVIWKPI